MDHPYVSLQENIIGFGFSRSGELVIQWFDTLAPRLVAMMAFKRKLELWLLVKQIFIKV